MTSKGVSPRAIVLGVCAPAQREYSSSRLTNAFSKKVLNLSAAVALYFMYCNYCRVHQTIKTTPAVASGLADHVWSIEEIVGLLDSN